MQKCKDQMLGNCPRRLKVAKTHIPKPEPSRDGEFLETEKGEELETV